MRDAISFAGISNNIISQNQDYQIFEERKKASFQYNLINNDDKGTYYSWDAGAIYDIATLNAHNSITADFNVEGSERFVDISNGDYHLNGDSTAINQGGSAVISKYDIGYSFCVGVSDIGAYEYDPSAQITKPIYRFWSDTFKHHFYTIYKAERDVVLNTYSEREWKYEGVGYYVYPN